ncbi:YkvA family protein [Mesotoga sp.]|uniref:YkvA family protein n=1 Tax=Mesotoga sp. TaxID=2053577 RepID=UPI0025933CC4|nr:YkvA family protein [Mesotoga sp.]HRX66102.1 YkvA family protein [Mesotoga sp.]
MVKKKKIMTFQKAKKEAESDYVSSQSKSFNLLSTVLKLLSDPRVRREVGGFFGKITLFIEMVKEYFQGNYREIPVKTITSIIAALIYLASPVDAIPDFIVVIGFVDDISVIAYVFRALNEDIESFKNWKEGKEGLESE